MLSFLNKLIGVRKEEFDREWSSLDASADIFLPLQELTITFHDSKINF